MSRSRTNSSLTCPSRPLAPTQRHTAITTATAPARVNGPKPQRQLRAATPSAVPHARARAPPLPFLPPQRADLAPLLPCPRPALRWLRFSRRRRRNRDRRVGHCHWIAAPVGPSTDPIPFCSPPRPHAVRPPRAPQQRRSRAAVTMSAVRLMTALATAVVMMRRPRPCARTVTLRRLLRAPTPALRPLRAPSPSSRGPRCRAARPSQALRLASAARARSARPGATRSGRAARVAGPTRRRGRRWRTARYRVTTRARMRTTSQSARALRRSASGNHRRDRKVNRNRSLRCGRRGLCGRTSGRTVRAQRPAVRRQRRRPLRLRLLRRPMCTRICG